MKKLKITNNSPAVLGFALASLAVLILGFITGGSSNQLLFMTYHSSLKNPLTYVRFFTHVLGHNGWSHFIGNMSYILLLGPMLEEKYGSGKVLEVIGITALVTGIVNYILFPSVALCGASGVVFAFILLVSFTNVREGEIPLTVLLVALIFIGQQVYEGIFLRDNVSNLSHILGGIVGAVAGYKLNIGKKDRK
jgi:GlpG protein